MTPKFAEVVDPIYLQLFPILERLGTMDSRETAGTIRRGLQELLQQANTKLAVEGRNWSEFSRYALVAWLDEMLGLAHDWPGKQEWTDQPLELIVFATRDANQEFYQRAGRAPSESNTDATESFYVSVMLGFVGLYRDPHSAIGREQVHRLGLPPDLSAWVHDYGQIVRDRRGLRGQGAVESPERVLSASTPHWNRAVLVWPAVLSVVFAGINVLAWWW